MAGTRRVTVELLGDAKGAKKAVKDTDDALGHLSITGRASAGGLRILGTGMKGLAVAATATAVVGVAALVGFGKSVVTVGTQYQTSLNSMQAVTHSTDAEMVKVAKTARDLGNDLTLPATSAADAANAMVELAKGNLTADQAMAAAKGTLQLAAAAQIDGATAATDEADALNAFGLAASQAGHVADVLANAADSATGDISDFALGMQASAAVAHQFGISLDDTVTALAELANAGIKGSDAGTSLKTTLIAMVHPSKQSAEAFKHLGITAFDAGGHFEGLSKLSGQLADAQQHMTKQAFNAAAATAFGTDAVRTAGVLANAGAAGFDKMSASIGRQGGAAQVAAAQMKGLGGAFQGLQSQIETVKIDIFTKEAPHLEAFVRLLSAKLPAAADAGLRGLDRLTSLAEKGFPIAQAAVERFGPAVQTWVQGKLELAGHAAEAIAGPALRGIGNILEGLAPRAEAAGHAIDSGLRAGIDATAKVAQGFELNSRSLGQSLGGIATSAGHAAHDVLPVLKVALAGAAGAANVLVTSLSGAAAILAPFAGDALLAASAIKGISLASSGFSAVSGVVGKVTASYGAMADKASFAAGTVTQRLGQALGKDLNTAASAGATAMTASRTAFTLLGGAAVAASIAVLAVGYAHQKDAQEAAANTAEAKKLYDTLHQGGQAGQDARHTIDGLTSALSDFSKGSGEAGAAGRAMLAEFQAGDAAYQSLSELDKVGVQVTATQNNLAIAIHKFGPASAEAAAAQIPFNAALQDQRILQLALGDATAKSTQSLADYTDKVIAAASSSVQLAGQEISVRQGELGVASATALVTDQVARYGKNSTQAKEASAALAAQQNALKGQILGAATAAGEAAKANDKTGSSAHVAAAGAAAERAELVKLAAGLAPNSSLRKFLQQTINQLNAFGGTRTATVNVVVHSPTGITVGRLGTGPQARASGGPVRAGQPYVVGEHRPELFVPKTDGMIVPQIPASVGAVAGRSGGGNTYNITVNIAPGGHPAEAGRQIVQAIGEYEKRSGTRWRS
jgi:TP901 family phage tail tape measure protein